MVEGLPAFFAASRFGDGLVAAMVVVFTLATTVTVCHVVRLLERRVAARAPWASGAYGEVLSGVFIALVGLFFLWTGL